MHASVCVCLVYQISDSAIEQPSQPASQPARVPPFSPIEVRRGLEGKEELAAVGVGPRIGHRQSARGRVREVKVLVWRQMQRRKEGRQGKMGRGEVGKREAHGIM